MYWCRIRRGSRLVWVARGESIVGTIMAKVIVNGWMWTRETERTSFTGSIEVIVSVYEGNRIGPGTGIEGTRKRTGECTQDRIGYTIVRLVSIKRKG